MEMFVKLTVIGQTGKISERVFNLRYIKAIQPDICTVLLYGNMKPFVISRGSMDELLATIERSESKEFEEKKGIWWKCLFFKS